MGLTNSFNSALIKLIPKKGDSTNLKNWRPISLLNCMYKILSRAANNRLKKVRDLIFSRAQKGFSGSRYIQEVLINVIETIEHCNKNGLSGVMLSLDQSKAFDSISHKYLSEVYRFFGVSPSFTNLMETLCNNRTACIIFDDGTFSDPIKLGQGRAQGNSPSPIEYNMGQQILLFKLELDPGINSVYNHFLVPRPAPLSIAGQHAAFDPGGNVLRNMRRRCFRNESNRETDKTDGFADDCTVITKFEFASLHTLKGILINFGNISGLRCNMEKTSIMAIGAHSDLTNEIISLGYESV